MRWLVASLAAITLHAMLAAMFFPFLIPQEVKEAPLELAKLTFSVLKLDETRGAAQKPEETPVDQSALPSSAAPVNAVPQRRAKAAENDDIVVVAQVAPQAPATKTVVSTQPPVKAATTVAARLDAVAIDAAQLAAAPSDTQRLKTIDASVRVTSENLSSPRLEPSRPQTIQTAGAVLVSTAAPAVFDAGTNLTAELAFAGRAKLQIDDRTLASLQTFLSSDVVNSGENAVRDDLAAFLAGQDCARLQAVFLPESGIVELRGHVPNADLRQPLLTALQERIGAGLPVRDNLLILPAPQCSVLGRIAAVGLPQSDEQLTNPRMIGQDTHAKEYRYYEGDRLKIELTAPEYGAYVYVDYYDAEGQVIHLVPNEQTELVYYNADAPFIVGGSDAGGLDIRIGPPFGQDIAVAFASSHPLFETPRPLIEPAEPYLAALAERVMQMRSEQTEFKGEWAYLFVRTQAAQN